MKKWLLQLFSLMLVFQLSIGTLPSSVFAEENQLSTSTDETNDVSIIEDEIENTEEVTETEENSSSPPIVEDENVEAEIEQENKSSNKEVNEDATSSEKEPAKEVVKEGETTVLTKEKVAEGNLEETTTKNKANTGKKKLTTSAVVTEKILSNIQFLDGKNNPIVAGTAMEIGDSFTISSDWALPNNHSYHEGDTYTFSLPKQFLIEGEQTGNLDGFGTYKVSTDGTVVFTFSEEVKNNSNVNGKFLIISTLTSDGSNTPAQQLEITRPVGTDASVGIIIKPKVESSFTKKGELDKAQNSQKAIWTIDVNKKLEQLNEIVINDTIPKGLTLDSTSIKVYELNMKLDGSSNLGPLVSSSFTSFPITLTNGKKAYRIVYETKFDEQENKKYENKATMTSGEVTVPATASVTTSYTEQLTKKYTEFDSSTKVVTWEIHYNKRGNTISAADAYFDDTFTSGPMEYVDGSITVEELNNGNWSSVPSSMYDLTKRIGSPAGFKLQFKNEVTKEYRIKYKTKVNSNFNKNEVLKNKVSTVDAEVEAELKIKNVNMNKKHNGMDYEKNEVSWTIDIFASKDKVIESGAILTDVYNEPYTRMNLIKESLVITMGTTVLVENTDYTFISNDENGFKIEFLRNLTENVVLKYKTIPDSTTSSYKPPGINASDPSVIVHYNTAEFKGNTTTGVAINSTDSDYIYAGKYAQTNGYKNGSYNYADKQFIWNIGINYIKEKVNNLVVEDFSPQGLQVIKDSIEIYTLDLSDSNNGGNPGVKNKKFTNFKVEESVKDGQPSFKIIFLEPVQDAFLITYKSFDADGVIEANYTNKAVVSGSKRPGNFTATVPVVNGGKYTAKSGKQVDDVINWTVKYNFTQSTLSNAKLVDEPSDNQMVLKDSFHVYQAIASTKNDGDFTKGNEIPATDYRVDIATDGSFKLNFVNDISSAYFIEYQSYINASPGDTLINKVWAEATEKSTVDTPSTEAVKVVKTNAFGSGTGEVGSLTVQKVDTFDQTKALENVEFELWTLDGNGDKKHKIKENATDKDGKIVFSKLLYKEYLLQEVKAAKGYTITLTGETKTEVNGANQTLLIKNMPDKTVGKLIIKKVDAANLAELLAGAKFDLIDAKGNAIFTGLTTNASGLIEKNVQLELALDSDGNPLSTSNDFTLVETDAPKGYKIDKKEIKVTISYGKTTTVEVKNNKIPPVNPIEEVPSTPTDSTDGGGKTPPSDSTNPDGKTPPSDSTNTDGKTPPSDSTNPDGKTPPSDSTNPDGKTPPSDSTNTDGKTPPSDATTNGGTPSSYTGKTNDSTNLSFKTGSTDMNQFDLKNPTGSHTLPQTSEASSAFLIWMGAILLILSLIFIRTRRTSIH
ncbi:MAG: LPXTG cell wall anchor domain-containing protein [Kurthia sp.]|nr:LPXTG cell wall anchor domain-containing protein [Candidatus Kurthia equi]